MFGKLINPSYPKTAIGIEQDSVTAVGLSKSGRRQFSVKQAATVGIAENVLRPSFSEPNVLNYDEMLISLNEAASNAGLARQKRWSVSLPNNAARSTILTLDAKPTSKQESADVLNWKAERSFGASISEIRLTTQPLPNDSEGKPRYFASAIKLSVLDEYETLFESLGWNVGMILPRQVCESKWLIDTGIIVDSLLISSQVDGMSAVLIRNNQPNVVRTITCTKAEFDDEIYRLLMFYRDRFEADKKSTLEKILLVGEDLNIARIEDIANEALGKIPQILRPEDVGLSLPASNLRFGDIAAPAGLASFAWS
jgi:Tfp pilus assembly PilM family ATPase